MNRSNLVLTLAVLLGILFLASTCGVALANPVFYVKITNKTPNPAHVHYYWSTRAGGNATPSKVTVIQPGYSTTFHGPAGNGRMLAWTQTTGESPKKVQIDGYVNADDPDAQYVIKYNQEGKLRIYKAN